MPRPVAVLPNASAPVIVQMGVAILVAAGLGFFGLGVQPPTPEWGELLGEAHNYIFQPGRRRPPRRARPAAGVGG